MYNLALVAYISEGGMAAGGRERGVKESISNKYHEDHKEEYGITMIH